MQRDLHYGPPPCPVNAALHWRLHARGADGLDGLTRRGGGVRRSRLVARVRDEPGPSVLEGLEVQRWDRRHPGGSICEEGGVFARSTKAWIASGPGPSRGARPPAQRVRRGPVTRPPHIWASIPGIRARNGVYGTHCVSPGSALSPMIRGMATGDGQGRRGRAGYPG